MVKDPDCRLTQRMYPLLLYIFFVRLCCRSLEFFCSMKFSDFRFVKIWLLYFLKMQSICLAYDFGFDYSSNLLEYESVQGFNLFSLQLLNFTCLIQLYRMTLFTCGVLIQPSKNMLRSVLITVYLFCLFINKWTHLNFLCHRI